MHKINARLDTISDNCEKLQGKTATEQFFTSVAELRTNIGDKVQSVADLLTNQFGPIQGSIANVVDTRSEQGAASAQRHEEIQQLISDVSDAQENSMVRSGHYHDDILSTIDASTAQLENATYSVGAQVESVNESMNNVSRNQEILAQKLNEHEHALQRLSDFSDANHQQTRSQIDDSHRQQTLQIEAANALSHALGQAQLAITTGHATETAQAMQQIAAGLQANNQTVTNIGTHLGEQASRNGQHFAASIPISHRIQAIERNTRDLGRQQGSRTSRQRNRKQPSLQQTCRYQRKTCSRSSCKWCHKD